MTTTKPTTPEPKQERPAVPDPWTNPRTPLMTVDDGDRPAPFMWGTITTDEPKKEDTK